MPRLEVAVITRDGDALVVNAARPASLVAFSDAHEGKSMPETFREIAWIVHRALDVEQPLDEWLATLEDVSAMPEDVAVAKRILAGDEAARAYVLGELDELPDPTPTDPALAQLNGEPSGALTGETSGGRSSPA